MNSGEIISLQDLQMRLLGQPVVGNPSFRVTGFVVFVNAPRRFCQIQHGDAFLIVDLDVVSMSELHPEALVQFIGELRSRRKEGKVELTFII